MSDKWRHNSSFDFYGKVFPDAPAAIHTRELPSVELMSGEIVVDTRDYSPIVSMRRVSKHSFCINQVANFGETLRMRR